MSIAEYIKEKQLNRDELAIWFLGQAGFCIKTMSDVVMLIDPYLSNYCQMRFGFKRMIPSILHPDELAPDLMLITHKHADHLDPDSLPFFVRNEKTCFITAPDCREALDRENVPLERRCVLRIGDETERLGIRIRAVYADHGDLAPDAVGYEVHILGNVIYFAGDTSFRPKEITASLSEQPDIMITPINGEYGNMNGNEACKLASRIRAKVLIGCHTGMFIEHGGDPAGFVLTAAKRLNNALAMVMAPGEELLYSRERGICGQSVQDPLSNSRYKLIINQ